MVTVGSAGSADRYFPTFDGNGNVSEYLDATGATVAHYEYDPFGKTTVAMGSKANDFAHRFSTKPLDLTTGLYYYGYRYYDPNTGRWPSRDPIEEDGGMNLYNFVGNHSANAIDILGREEMAVAAGAAVAIGGGTPWLTSALFTPAAAIVGVVGIVVLTPMTIDAVGEAIESTAAENSIREQGVELQRTLDARRRALEQERAQEAACTKDPVICWVVRSYVQGPGWRCDIECSNGLKFAVPCGAQAPGTTYPWPGAPPNEEEGEEWPPL